MGCTNSEKGSQWQRWDMHIHAPDTLHNNGFKGDWDGYFDEINKASPAVSALGIADYFTLNSYKKAVAKQKNGKIPNVWLFPNIELRLDIAGKSWINFHFIFSPEDPKHIELIERELTKLEFKVDSKQIYRCSDDSLRELGRYHDPSQSDERGALKVGALQFKASLDDIEKILEIPWVRKNAITAVSGANGDGTAALRGASEAIRKRIESLADIIFSGSEKTQLFWLEPSNGLSPKPTVFSCDAHENDKVLKPENEKYCWLKGDVCFDTLKQILLEPKRRVYLGKHSEQDPPPYAVINSIEVKNSPWFSNGSIPLNSGLVAIIGARGSGKTALADLIAMGAGVYDSDNRDSFIFRAQEYLSDLKVNLIWGSGSTSYEYSDYSNGGYHKHDVKYLSQHFVNRLCSHEHQSELREEIERIIYGCLDPEECRNTSSFSELESLLLAPYQSDRKQTKNLIEDAHTDIVELTKTIDTKSSSENSLKESQVAIQKKEADLRRFVKDNKNIDEVNKVTEKINYINTFLRKREEMKATIKQTISRLNALSRSILSENQRIKGNVNAWKNNYSDIDSLQGLWGEFSLELSPKANKYIAEVEAKLTESLKLIDNPIQTQKNTPAISITYKDIVAIESSSFENMSTVALVHAAKLLTNYLVTDEKQQKIFTREQKNLESLNRKKQQIEKQLTKINHCNQRIKEIRTARRGYYSNFFELLDEEAKVLEELYTPLKERLLEVGGTCGDLEFFVHRKIQFEEWINKGKSLFDGRILKIDLEKEARIKLLPIWENGEESKIASALNDFHTKHWGVMQEAVLDRYSKNLSQWKQEVAGWMYSVDHISLEYGIRYKGVHLDQLSSGTKGIVLLLLYLVIDTDDNRPLLIDQPEENLDPNSIFEELVGPFREICKRRQVIIVTHNPNLVVNTDVDQVIIANMEAPDSGGLPQLSYECGAIENKTIRDLVCNTLEGGEKAFLDREKRYRLESKSLQLNT